VRRDGQRIRLITDALGSVRAAIDIDTGAVLQRLSYDAYGRTTQDTNPGLQPFGYKGAFADPVAEGAGLVWMGVRAYQPSLARFTTPDPQGLAAVWNDADALAGDPVNLEDIDGELPDSVHRFVTSVGNGMGNTVVGAAKAGLAVGAGPVGARTLGSALDTFRDPATQLNNWGGHPQWDPCPGLANTAGEFLGGSLIGGLGGSIERAAARGAVGSIGRLGRLGTPRGRHRCRREIRQPRKPREPIRREARRCDPKPRRRRKPDQ
jgi:RHS repeat-associated protein